MLLVKFKGNYADEFDVEGFKIYNDDEEFSKAIHNFIEDQGLELVPQSKVDKEMAEARKLYEEEGQDDFDSFDEYLEEYFLCSEDMMLLGGKVYYQQEFEWYFGSNESIEFENVDDLLHCFKTIYINDVTADHLKGLFNGRKFGIFPL